ncbi:MAG: hypothetical protein WBI01_00545 [Syntrophomonadaceae bacterium]
MQGDAACYVAMEQARHWQALFSVLISRANREAEEDGNTNY